MSRIVFNVLALLLFLSLSYCRCGDMFSNLIDGFDAEAQTTSKTKPEGLGSGTVNKKIFKKGNKRWFRAKKDLMKFTPQAGIELGKKVARNVSIGVIWIYEPGLLLAEELVSPCFGIISYYPNVQITVMKGERFLGIICDAREHKPVNTDRFKWYIAIGDDLTFTARHYVKEGAYIKEGQEIGHLSRPAKSVGRVAIKSRARCSGIIVLCKTGLVNTGEEFLRISCDAAPGTADVKNSLVDETHSSLLDQSDLGKSVAKLRGLAQVTAEEADYDNQKVKLPQIINSAGGSGPEDQAAGEDRPRLGGEEPGASKATTRDAQSDKNGPPGQPNTLDETISDSCPEPNNKPPSPPPDSNKNKNFFDFDFDEEEEDNKVDDETGCSAATQEAEPKPKAKKEKEPPKSEQAGNSQESSVELAPDMVVNTGTVKHSMQSKSEPTEKRKPSRGPSNSISPIGRDVLHLDGLSSSVVSEMDISSLD